MTAQIIVGVGMAAHIGEAPTFSDPTSVREIYVEEIGHIEIKSGLIKITLTVGRNVGDGPEQVAVCRLVVPVAHVPRQMEQVSAVMDGKPFMSDDVPPDVMPH